MLSVVMGHHSLRVLAILPWTFAGTVVVGPRPLHSAGKPRLHLRPLKNYTKTTGLGESVAGALNASILRAGYLETTTEGEASTHNRAAPSTTTPEVVLHRVGDGWEVREVALRPRQDRRKSREHSPGGRERDADFVVSGLLGQGGNALRLDLKVRDANGATVGVVTGTAEAEGEVFEMAEEAATRVVNVCRAARAETEASAIMQRYRTRLVTRRGATQALQQRLQACPKSVALQAVLLALYAEEPNQYADEIIKQGNALTQLVNLGTGESVKLFMRMGLDPFEEVAQAYARKEQWDDVVGVHERAVSVFPLNVAAHLRSLGEAYARVGRTDDAAAAYQRAVERNAASPKAHLWLAKHFDERGNRARALTHYRRCARFAADSTTRRLAKRKTDELSEAMTNGR